MYNRIVRETIYVFSHTFHSQIDTFSCALEKDLKREISLIIFRRGKREFSSMNLNKENMPTIYVTGPLVPASVRNQFESISGKKILHIYALMDLILHQNVYLPGRAFKLLCYFASILYLEI